MSIINDKEKKPELSFEEALAKLETIVRQLESGNAKLDESMKLYEEGVSLVKYCSQTLEKAQQQVITLTGTPAGAEENDPSAQ
ncbi:MAG: exodeoxyribonuclease VII small subunit [Clostridia bacterium]|nr:exodeoxyribonuclease VII small subunit [Clostridia bacterium]